MEKVQEQEQTIEVFENDIQMYLTMFCEENGIEDMTQETQARWNACLLYIRRHVFNNKDILKDKTPLNGYYNNDYDNKYNNLNNSNCNRYNIDMVNSICDYYIYICLLNNKAVSIAGFCNLTGIDDKTIYAWGADDNKLSTSGSEIYQKLNNFNEQYYEGLLADGKRNPLGAFGVLKHRHGWESPYTGDRNKQRKDITAEEIRQLIQQSGINRVVIDDKNQNED